MSVTASPGDGKSEKPGRHPRSSAHLSWLAALIALVDHALDSKARFRRLLVLLGVVVAAVVLVKLSGAQSVLDAL